VAALLSAALPTGTTAPAEAETVKELEMAR